jgi:bifunctional non-homologous end joining protein LigD
MVTTIRFADLYYSDPSSNSDKEYHIQLHQITNGYDVTCQWGRRGSTLQSQTKISGVDIGKAEKVFEKVVNEKVGKGYTEGSGTTSTSYVTPTVAPVASRKVSDDGLVPMVTKRKIQFEVLEEKPLVPQLLNSIDESEVEVYLQDDNFGCQPKMDGRHQLISVAGGMKVFNKKGKEIGYPKEWADAVSIPVVLDGEAIGDTFHVFDLLQVDGHDLRLSGYKTRYDRLSGLRFGEFIKKVPLAVGYIAKKGMYDQLKRDGKEGVVFKRLSAVHRPGKAHSDMVKFKFYSEASVRVCKGREGKQSVGMEVLDGDKWVFVGNVTTIGKGDIKAGNILEIRYLYVQGKGGHLYQPTVKEIRDDVDESECVIGQLKYKAEED